jgi:hypothetical protein
MFTRMISLLTLAVASEAFAEDPSDALERRKEGEWITYRVAINDPSEAQCCFDFDRGRVHNRVCQLDAKNRSFGRSDRDPPPAFDEALQVFVRRGRKGFDRALAVGTSCPVEFGSARVTTLHDVSARDSIALLERGDGIPAIAQHAGAIATQSLIKLAASSNEKSERRDAYFWLAEARGRDGYRAVRDALDREGSDDLRRHLVFCLSESDEPEASRELARLAREHRDEDIRGEALFWLSETEHRDAERIIREAIDRDPSEEVRKKAVFALSELPPDRAIAALKQLIERKQPRAIRREALFWLAQIKDDAVLSVFDELLR